MILQVLILSFSAHGFENLFHDRIGAVAIGLGFVAEPLLEFRDRDQHNAAAPDGWKLGEKLAEGAFRHTEGLGGFLRAQGKAIGQPEAMFDITVTITVIAGINMDVMIVWIHVVFRVSDRSRDEPRASQGQIAKKQMWL